MLYLASASPRRAEILTMLGFDFKAEPAFVDETVCNEAPPAGLVMDLSRKKAQAVAKYHPEDVVLGSDTLVALDGAVLGKPRDEAEAEEMLERLSGKTHTVYTGVYIINGKSSQGFVDSAQVSFYPLTKREIRGYIATGEPMDKAGAYAVQGKGSVFVCELSGDFFTVMGLPAAKTARALHGFGFSVF